MQTSGGNCGVIVSEKNKALFEQKIFEVEEKILFFLFDWGRKVKRFWWGSRVFSPGSPKHNLLKIGEKMGKNMGAKIF